MGYTEEARIRDYYDAGEDKIVFWKALAMTEMRIEQLGSETELDALEPLWIALHNHHRSVSDFQGLVPDDQTSWRRRRSHYADLIRRDEGVILVARDGDGPVGYAVARIIDEPDDTYDTRDRYAELESLSVRADSRSSGIGTHLLDRRQSETGALIDEEQRPASSLSVWIPRM